MLCVRWRGSSTSRIIPAAIPFQTFRKNTITKTAGLMIEGLWVWVPAGVVGEFSSSELTLCDDSYLVSISPPCCRSGTWNTPVFLPGMQVAGYTRHACTLDLTKLEWADYAAGQAYWRNLSRNRLTCNLSGNIQPHLSSLSHCRLAYRVELVCAS